ncbi:MAG: hypothetical protein CL907_06455 [Dehalococcoidia bacterium]|nr:hypothetical protein [Dehalococcoidia bacterium]
MKFLRENMRKEEETERVPIIKNNRREKFLNNWINNPNNPFYKNRTDFVCTNCGGRQRFLGAGVIRSGKMLWGEKEIKKYGHQVCMQCGDSPLMVDNMSHRQWNELSDKEKKVYLADLRKRLFKSKYTRGFRCFRCIHWYVLQPGYEYSLKYFLDSY